MSFSKAVILQLVILGVVLESDLGHKRISFFRIARPVIAAVLIVPVYLTTVPTSGHNLALQAAGAVVGAVLGLISVSPAIVAVRYDPAFRGWWARKLKRSPRPASVTTAGAAYATIWIVVAAARLTFAYTSQHTFPHALGRWLAQNQLDGSALTNSFILLAVCMDLFRSIGLLTRGSAAKHRSHQTAAAPAL